MEFLRNFQSFIENEEGASIVEYGIFVAIFSVALVGALTVLGNDLGSFFNATANQLQDISD